MLEFLAKWWREFNAMPIRLDGVKLDSLSATPREMDFLPKRDKQMDAFLSMLGKKVKDKVTGFEGRVSSIAFDLYGCVQAVVSPGINDKDGKLGDGHWFDFKRLEVIDHVPAMPVPVYKAPGFEIGAAEKPAL